MRAIIGKIKLCAQQQMAAELLKSGTKHPYSSTQCWPVAIALLCLPGQLLQ
jgi:hypothetical protein